MAVASTMLPLGTVAPDFALPQPGGAVISLGDALDPPASVVAFLCNHCPYVRHIADRLAVVTADLIDRGVAVYGISSNDIAAYPEDGPDEMGREAEARGYRFPYLYDEDQTVARAYRAACTPDFFVFDRDRRLVYRGQFDSSRPSSDQPVTGAHLVAAVEAVLSGDPPLADQLPSLGCSIKWRPGTQPPWA
jgi:peroxiredoxin